MADLKLDDEFGAALAGAGSRPAFSNLVKYSRKEELTQREFPTTMQLRNVRIQIGANPEEVDPDFRKEINAKGVMCNFRIANESFRTTPFKPDGGSWTGQGDIQFMLAGNSGLFCKVVILGEPEMTLGYARLGLHSLGQGEFDLTGEIKESEYVSMQDELLGYITVSFTVVQNFLLNVTKLENQYDTKNIPALMSVVSQDSKTLGHRIGAFQSALKILQNIVAELKKQGAVEGVTSKQLSVILNQASSAQGVELFEDLLWDVAKLSFAEHIFEPSLTFFPGSSKASGCFLSLWHLIGGGHKAPNSKEIVGDLFDVDHHPFSFALQLDLHDPVVLVAESEADFLRWTAVLKIACDANSETNPEKLKKLTIPDFCKDPFHADHPTVGWLKRKKAQKKAFSSGYVKRFFKLTCDEDNHYSLYYSHELAEDVKTMTKVPILEGTRVLLPAMLGVPTPFALSVNVQKISDFSFPNCNNLHVVGQLGSQKQRTRSINSQQTTEFNSHLLIPVQQDVLPHANESVTTVNIGWFGEEVPLPPKGEVDPVMYFFVGDAAYPAQANEDSCAAYCSVPFSQLPFGRAQEMTLPLEGPGSNGADITLSITMRRLGQYKTAWPANKSRIIQNATTCEKEDEKWEGGCTVRAAPQGLEIYNARLNPDNPYAAVSVIDYYSIESIIPINESTLDVVVIIENNTSASQGGITSPRNGSASPGYVHAALRLAPFSLAPGCGRPKLSNQRSMVVLEQWWHRRGGGLSRRSSFGMVNTKGKSVSPAQGEKKQAPPNDYMVLRITPCPAETLKDLLRERKWMFRDRSMLLYITHKLHQIRLESESPEGTGPITTDPKTREKLAIASSETYRRIRANMSEIIKTANWKHARGVGFTEEHIRMFFRLQRLSCYFAKLVESKAAPLWALNEPIELEKFARGELDRIFSSQYVQAGTFGAEAQGIENSVKGVGHALRSLHRRMDEVKLFHHDEPQLIETQSAKFFHEYYLRCIGELGAHVISDDVLHEVPIEVVVAFVCFLVKRDKAFHELLIENALEPNRNAFLTTILSIDSMIRRLTKRTELEIVSTWPKDEDLGADSGPYVASLLGDCSPDVVGKLSTRAPEELMRLLEKYVQLIASQCRARGNLGAKIFEGMFFALPSYASNAANAIFRINHAPTAWNAVRYLTAILNDMSRSNDLMEELVATNKKHLEGIPINTSMVNAGIFSSGIEVACLLVDIALKQMDDVCSEFFQAEWYSDEDNAVMRKACKLLCCKMDELEGMIHATPFFQYVVEAGVEKIAFRYLYGFVRRATDQSGGKMVGQEEIERIQADIEMMENYLKKYGPMVLTSVYHVKEAMIMLTEQPDVLLQAVFVDILRRHEGKEEHVMKLLKICTAVRDDLRSFYVPAWLNKLKQKMSAIVSERKAVEEESDGRMSEITFDVFEWVFTADVEQKGGAYIYQYLMQCLKRSSVSRA
ncbi:unnamed protein product [Chrysoparadoxa australica]